MSDELTKALDGLKEKTGGQGMESSVKFDIDGQGALRIDGRGPRMDDGSPADCTIRGDLATFRALFDGDLSPTSAFMTGRIRIDGDMGVAMKVAGLLG